MVLNVIFVLQDHLETGSVSNVLHHLSLLSSVRKVSGSSILIEPTLWARSELRRFFWAVYDSAKTQCEGV